MKGVILSLFSLSWVYVGLPVLSDDSSLLPGPGLDVPVDVDGDGVSSFGDRWAFNYCRRCLAQYVQPR